MIGPRILIADADLAAAAQTADWVAAAGYRVASTPGGPDALSRLADESWAMLLLSVDQRRTGGVDLCRQLRAASEYGLQVPVLFVSPARGEQTRVEALDAGADGYLERSVGRGELLARIRSLLRRGADLGAGTEIIELAAEVQLAPAHHRVTVRGVPVAVSHLQFGLLVALADAGGQPCGRTDLLRRVWGTTGSTPRTVDVAVHHLRQLIEPDPLDPQVILTVAGVGYRAEVKASAPAIV